MNIIFMGSPYFAVPALEALINSNHKISSIYTQAPKRAKRGQKETLTPIHEIALKYGISVYTPDNFKNDLEIERLKSFNADICVVVAYGLLIPQKIIDIFKYGVINIHPSLLPKWRGAAPLQRCIMAGDTESAVIIMKMDAGLDTGDILLSQNISLNDETNFGELHDKCAKIGADLLIKYLDNPNLYQPIPQNNEGVSYAKKISKEECLLSFDENGKNIIRKINGLSPKPGAYLILDNEIIKILKANFLIQKHNLEAGNLDINFKIACKDGFILPLIIQKAGGRVMEINEFLRGFKL